MAKRKECSVCKHRVECDNKGKLKKHLRWTWPGWPDTTRANSGNMWETNCEGAK